jgi:hypothetical protein
VAHNHGAIKDIDKELDGISWSLYAGEVIEISTSGDNLICSGGKK